MSDFIGVDISGIKEVQAVLAKVPPIVQDAVVDGVSVYLKRVFQKYPPENHSIRRKQAYPEAYAIHTNKDGSITRIQGYFSWRQYKKVMALLRDGQVPYTRRKPGMSNKWQIIGKGRQSILANETQAAVYTMGDGTQARFSKLVGWRTISDIVEERIKQIERVANDSARKALKKNGIGV